jgi:L-malate glycosyltransferase
VNPLKLVLFTKAFYIGGTESQVIELLRGLPPERYQTSVAVIDEVGPLLEDVWKLGHLPRSFPLRGSYLSANTAWQIARLARWLRDRRADLVHVHDFYSTLLAVPAARLAGAKVIVGRLDLLHWHGRWRSLGLRGLTHLADHVIANAEAVKHFVVTHDRIRKEKITVIRNGIDLLRFDVRARQGLAEPLPEVGGAPLAVHVANMSHPVKRQEDFLRAMALVPRLHCFFVGDGPRRAELERIAHQVGVARRAHFLGFRKDGPAIQARATLGVLTSELEGLSNAVIEGMSSRLPMVVTAVGGNPELILDGERGWVVPPRDPEAMARAIRQVIGDPIQARVRGESARAFVERELTLDRLVANHDRLYRDVARPAANHRLASNAAIA